MTTANQAYTFDALIDRIPMPESGGTTSSGSFRVPKGAKVVTIYTPDLATSTSLVLYGLMPSTTVEASQSWVALEVFSLVDGSLVALDGLTESKAITLPVAALGGGLLKFVAADTQAGAPTTIHLVWGRDG
jgi:hypothetical protein